MELPRRVGDYEVVRQIAVGGQGVVCEALGPGGVPVALKVLLDPDPEMAARFRREARTLLRLRHPHLLRVIELGDPERFPFPYMALELIRGRDLEAWVAADGPPSAADVVEVVGAVADALAHCHAQGVVHRDVKPRNVILEERTGRAVLVDFGLVRRRRLELAWETQDQLSLTQAGEVVGTPGTMAPEQVSPELGEVDARTDVYGLGGLLFFLLVGAPPFKAPTVMSTLLAVIEEAPVDPRVLRPDVAPALAELCLRCLAKAPEERPASASAFAEELRRAQRPPGGRRGVAVAAAVASALAAVGVGVAIGVGGDAPARVATPSASVTPSPEPIPLEELVRQAEDASRPDAERAQLYKQAAERGSALGCMAYGQALMGGLGVPRDPQQGIRWLRRGAELGNLAAKRSLGIALLDFGDPLEAISALEEAAGAGDLISMRALGLLYGSGRGLGRQDPVKALAWWRRAAERGDVDSIESLGLILSKDLRPRAQREAFSWLSQAAEAGRPRAMASLAVMYVLGGPAVDPNPEEAARWARRSAAKGDLKGMELWGSMLHKGVGVPQDVVAAERWWRRSAEGGLLEGMSRLGALLAQTDRRREGTAWMRRAAEKGHVIAALNLGVALLLGHGAEADPQEAVKWLRFAAEAGNAKAMANLGQVYAEGRGVKRDWERSTRWYRQAAERGSRSAMLVLGFRRMKGVGAVKKDLKRARALLEEAARDTDPDPEVRQRARRLLRQLGGAGD